MYIRAGQPRCIEDRHKVPKKRRTVPRTSGHLRRRVYVIRKPVAVPAMEATAEEMTRRRPEVVAVVRRTPWKKRGLWREVRARIQDSGGGRAHMLKRMALEMKAPTWLEYRRFICGD